MNQRLEESRGNSSEFVIKIFRCLPRRFHLCVFANEMRFINIYFLHFRLLKKIKQNNNTCN